MRLAVLILISCLAVVSGSAAQANLAGFWNFDQGAGVDSSGRGNDGRVSGAPLVIDGVAGKALLFNGATDYIDLQKNLFNNATEFTIAFYWKPYAWGYKVSLVGQNDLVEFLLGSNSVQLWSPKGSIDCTLPPEAALHTWTHIAATGMSGNLSVYVNGRLQRSIATGGTLNVSFTESDVVSPRKWKVLFLAVRNMNLENGLTARLTDQDIQQGFAAFEDAGRRWVNTLSYGLAEWQLESRTIEDVRGNLVWEAQYQRWQDNIDTARFLADANLPGLGSEYDTVFFFWPRVPDGATTWVCCTAYGGGFGVSVPNSWPRAFGWTDAVKEVRLHEWLHTAENHYRSQGRYTGQDGLHGHEAHGYQMINDSWLAWCKDYMRGQVVESAQFVGIPPAAWRRQPRRAARSRAGPAAFR